VEGLPLTPQAVVDFYDQMGEDYCHWSPSLNIHFGYFRRGMNPFNLEAMLDRMTLEVMNRLALAGGNPTVLDVGCGVGASSRMMARCLPEASFHGITISPWQVAFGEKMNRKSGLADRILLHEADFQKMPFPENFANAAFAIESACYADGLDKAGLVREISRVLKPGGRLVVVDGFRKHSRPYSAFLDKIYRRYLSLWAVEELADIHLFKKALQTAGFEKIKAEDISWNVALTAAHIPVTILKFLVRRGLFQKAKIPKIQKNYLKALALTMVMGLWKRHFGYYIVTCEKK
jgi:MPBQ/MSBQ methyltransferase